MQIVPVLRGQHDLSGDAAAYTTDRETSYLSALKYLDQQVGIDDVSVVVGRFDIESYPCIELLFADPKSNKSFVSFEEP